MIRTSQIVVLASIFLAAAAHADDGDVGGGSGGYTAKNYPLQEINRPFETPTGMTQLSLDLDLEMSSGLILQPISPILGVSYGVARNLSIEAAFGLCLNGPGTGCPSIAGGAAVGAVYSLGNLGPAATALTVGLTFDSFSPSMEMELPIGALFRFTPVKNVFSIVVAPQIGIGLTDRNTRTFDSLSIPVSLQFQATPELAVNLNTGFGVFIDPPSPIGIGDTLAIPVGVGALYAVNHQLDVGAEFNFPNLFGKNSSADARSLMILVNFRL